MMCAVRRLSVALAGLVSLAAVVAAGIPAGGAVGAGGSVAVRTVVGPGVLDTPGGLALGAIVARPTMARRQCPSASQPA